MADIDTIERLLCQRYNVQALDAGELSTALSLARGGNLQPLREALDARNLYRWRDGIYAELAAHEEAPEPEAAEVEEPLVAEEAPEPEPEPRRGRRR